jgi:3,4-dihydroxy 2-butanone 4-phosphate synthase/GTP cyclohydrolase II
MGMEKISERSAGILIYLRQEGRGIGLLNKLKTYELQDEGHDTVDANLKIGREADERSYEIAAQILKYFNVHSVELLTNNPEKVSGLEDEGILVSKRIDIHAPVTEKNHAYLKTKMERMDHKLSINESFQQTAHPEVDRILEDFSALLTAKLNKNPNRPVVSLSFAQSLDGSIASENGTTTLISGRRSLKLTHGLRAVHKGILIGIGTVLIDDPQLTVRLKDGDNPVPIILDSRLRISADARVLNQTDAKPVIVTTEEANQQTFQKLESKGVRIIQTRANGSGRINIEEMLTRIFEMNITSVMVEGGSEIITSFLQSRSVDLMLLTISPDFLGGVRGVRSLGIPESEFIPGIIDLKQQQLGKDIIVWGQAGRSES